MGKMVKVAAKKPEAKKENKASKTKQTGPSQSISSPVEQILLLQRTIGNQSVQRLIRSGTLQAKLKIGQPGDIYEREADRMAEHVMKMPQVFEEKKVSNPARNNPIQRLCSACIKGTKPKIEEEGKFIQTKEASGSTPEVTPQLESSINAARGGGQPLPESVRAFYEPRFGADFSQVRVDTGSYAAETAKSINAKAFTVGNNIAFGGGQFAPGTHEGGKLLAHELTHTIQQGAGVQRSPQISTMVAPPLVQRDLLDFLPDIPNPLEYLANKAIGFITRNAAAVPGFTMLTVVIGKNPLTGAAVDRSPGNILKGAIEMMPGGSFITEALNNHGIFDKVSAWTSQQFNTLKEIGSNILQDVKNFVNKFSILDLKDPGAVWEKAKNIVTAPIGQIKSFAIGLKNDIVTFVKDAILKPIAAYAKNNTNGYPLLCAVMGKDPISGEAVPQDANALLGGFMKFIGEEETWTNMQKAGAVPRAFAWFKGAVNAVKGFVSEIPGAFVAAFKALDITDLILIPKAFIKLAKVFGSFAGRFISWGFNAVWNLLEIIFDSLKPGIMGYIKRTGAALKSILKNPMPFVGNLVKAAIQGFKNFAANFGSHLKAGLIDWLTGSLTGVYIPKALSLLELGKFALSVLGITWTKIRGKIVKALGPTGEKIMKALETGFDMIVSLVKGGPAAAWELIKEKLSDLKDTVVSGIIGFVTETVVMKAVPKLIAMFIPGAGFISAIISIYDTIMVFVQKISKIAQVVVAFIDSIVTIAAGNIGAAASRVESILGGLVSLAISFLAGFAGLGKVADKIVGVIGKVIGAIDKAWDWVINIIVGKAKAWFAKLFGKKQPEERKEDSERSKLVKAKVGAELSGKKVSNAKEEEQLISAIYNKFHPEGLKSIKFVRVEDGLDVLVSASVADKVAKLTAPELPKIIFFGNKLKPYSRRTTILVSYDLDGKSFGPSISNKKGEGHAETRFKNKYLPKLIAKIRKNRAKLKTPAGEPVPVTLDINRTPCDGCSEYNLIKIANDYKGEIRLIVNPVAVTKEDWQSIEQTSVKSVVAMMKAGIKINASKVWAVIEAKLKEFPQFEFDGKMYDQGEVSKFKAEASGVQELIDKAIKKMEEDELKNKQKGS